MRLNDQLINLPNLDHVIDRSPLTISPDIYVVDAIALMGQARSDSLALNNFNSHLNPSIGSQPGTSYVLVVEGTQLLGIITEKDVVRIIASDINISGVKVSEVMTRQVVTLTQSDSQDVFTALLLLHQHQIRHLPIVDHQGQLLGIVTETNLLQAFDLVKMVSIIEVLQQHLQPTSELRPIHQYAEMHLHQQIEEVRHQAHYQLDQWAKEQSAELQLALEELQVAEEELRQQNEELAGAREVAELDRQRYQDLFEFAPHGYLVTDAAGIIKEANQAAAAILSVQEKYLVGKPLILFVAQEDRQFLMSQLNNEQRLQDWEIDLQPRGGEKFPARVRVAAVYEQEQLLGWRWLLCNISDVYNELRLRKQAEKALRHAHDELEVRVVERTAELFCVNARLQQEIIERQRVEQALRQSERLYRDLVESQTELVFRFDLQGRATFANLAASQTLGLSTDELRGQSIFQFVYPDDLPHVMQSIRTVASLPHSLRTSERRILTVNGVRWFEWNLTTIENHTGEVVEYQTVGRDITERKQIQEALRESEGKFRHFAENIHAVIWIASTDAFRILYVSPAYEDIWGRSCQSLREQPHTWIETVHPEDRDLVRVTVLEQHLSGEFAQVEYRILRPDGSIRWIWDRSFAIRNEQGQVYCYGSIAEDITERKQAEESLRQSEERLSLALESAGMGIWDWNLLTNEAIWSPNMGLVYGLPSSSLYSHNIEDFLNLIHPEDQQSLSQMIARSIEEAAEYAIEFRVIWPDNSVHWLNSRGQVYYNELGQPLRMIGTTRDITERKQAEQKIREQAALLDIATDAIMVRDLQTKILFWNKGAERLYGWQEQEALGSHVSELLYKENSPELQAALKNVMEHGSWQGELKKLQKSGAEAIVESRWTLVRNAMGQPTSILSVDTDITEKKQLETQFLRAQRMESLGTLAGGIAHDLNNILTPILAASQLLNLKYVPDEERYQQLRDIIESNAKRGAALVKQVLSFARGFQGERTIVQIKHLISEITQIAQQTFPKSIEFSISVPESLNAVYGDATQLHQVLMNLVVNARDAMPEGGNIRIVAENMFIDEAYAKMHLDAQVGHYIVVKIVDTGVGMTPEVLDRIFEPFFTTKDVGRGTGLGLSTVLGIIKSHGGFVNVSSQIEQGSQFMLFLPAVEATQEPNAEDLKLPKGNGELILVVDDESQIREIATIILENNHYRTLTAGNGIEAIAMYAQHKHQIRAVLMDMMMPEMDGIAAIRTLQKMNPLVKIIASSGLNSHESFSQTAGLEIAAVLSKPYTANELLNRLHQILTAGNRQ
ncbi:PAS domain S-box protein [Calothrix sp. PCC 7507]|uniref:PAS domain S-box protein n=1 Tax=Calothrix sp. PCC 7507 TaxID=99598 RepID=UPI00029EF9C2|nr:PAS domain S-box protein [Calothrix sp. PCC 7507]AFY32659.1 multi-sensor hybrid histidine kinase [Calothrix sp. PCC 7507]